jgi:hypothetical protein
MFHEMQRRAADARSLRDLFGTQLSPQPRQSEILSQIGEETAMLG